MDGASGETQSFVSELNLASRPMHNGYDVQTVAAAITFIKLTSVPEHRYPVSKLKHNDQTNMLRQ